MSTGSLGLPRPADWKETEQFYSEAAAHFRNIKSAWRNPISHAGGRFDEDRARDVLRATESFLKHLASRLSE